jgi:hypothetical protein
MGFEDADRKWVKKTDLFGLDTDVWQFCRFGAGNMS